MSDDRDVPVPDEAAARRPAVTNDESLREADEPLRQHGDALLDGSGSRQGQSPSVTDTPRDA